MNDGDELNHLGGGLVDGRVDLRPFRASDDAAAVRGDGKRGAQGEGVHSLN